MIRRCLELLASEGQDGTRRVLCSPAVGVYAGAPRSGEGLVEGSLGGSLVILGRTVDLVVPRGVRGTVVGGAPPRGARPVAYGEPLFELEMTGAQTQPDRAGSPETPTHRAGDPAGLPTPGVMGASAARLSDGAGGSASLMSSVVPAGLFALRAPTTGVFYGRPDPSSAPFVSAGSQLSQGQTAGLIEVMKSFSPIVHPGGELPSPALVVEVRVAEGAEVGHGQVLFLLRSV